MAWHAYSISQPLQHVADVATLQQHAESVGTYDLFCPPQHVLFDIDGRHLYVSYANTGYQRWIDRIRLPQDRREAPVLVERYYFTDPTKEEKPHISIVAMTLDSEAKTTDGKSGTLLVAIERLEGRSKASSIVVFDRFLRPTNFYDRATREITLGDIKVFSLLVTAKWPRVCFVLGRKPSGQEGIFAIQIERFNPHAPNSLMMLCECQVDDITSRLEYDRVPHIVWATRSDNGSAIGVQLGRYPNVTEVLTREAVIDKEERALPGRLVTTKSPVDDTYFTVVYERVGSGSDYGPAVSQRLLETVANAGMGDTLFDALVDMDEKARVSKINRILVGVGNSMGLLIDEEFDIASVFDIRKRGYPHLQEVVYDPIRGRLAIVATPHPVVVLELAELPGRGGEGRAVKPSNRLWPMEEAHGRPLPRATRDQLYQVLLATTYGDLPAEMQTQSVINRIGNFL